MATSVAKIQAELDLDSGKFSGTITSAVGQLKQFNTSVNNTDKSLKNIERRVTGLGASLRDTMVILGQFRAAMHTLWTFTGQWVGAIIEANAKLERLQVLMQGLSKSSTHAGRVTDALKDMNYVLEKSKNAPFTIDTIADSFVKLKASGIDPTKGSLDALTDAVAHFGGTSEQLHRATVAIQQMSGKGVVSMEELRQQLGEAIPNAMQLMARATNMSMGELVKTISLGRLEAKSALGKLFVEMQYEFQGSAKGMMDTWVGMVAKFKTEWLAFAKEIGDRGLFTGAKEGLKELTEFLGSSDGKKFARELGVALGEAVKMAMDLARWLVKNREALVSWGQIIAQVFIVKHVVQFGGALITTGVQITNWIRTVGGLTQAMAAARAGTIGWTAAIGAAAGPIGVAVVAIGSLIWYLKNQYDAAIAAGNAMQYYYDKTAQGQMVSPEEHRGMQERLDYLKRLNAAVQEAADKKSRMTAAGGLENQGSRNMIDSRLNELMAEGRTKGFVQDAGNFMTDSFKSLEEKTIYLSKVVTANVGRAMTDISRQEALQQKGRLDDIVTQYGQDIKAAADKAGPNISSQLAKIGDDLNAGKITKEESQAKRTQVLGGALDAKIKVLEASRQALADVQVNMAHDEKAVAGVTKLMDENNRLLDEVRQERETVMSANVLMPKMGKGGEGGAASKSNPLLDFYQQVSGKNAELQATLDGGIPKLEKFNELLAKGQYGKNIDQGLVAGIRALLKANDDLADSIKKNNATETLVQNLEDMEASAKADVISASVEASGNVYSQVAAGMVGFNRQVEVMRANLDKTNMSAEEFETKIAGIREELHKMDMIRFGEFVKDKAFENWNSTLPEKEQRLQAFNKQLAEYELLRKNMMGNNPDENAKVNDGVDQLIASETARFAYENRSAWQKWIDDYADVTEEMEGVWGDSLDTMADGMTDFLTTGKANWTEMASHILKEITRVLVSKAVSAFVNFVISMFGGGTAPGGSTGSSGGFSGGGTDYSGASQQYGGGGLPGYEDGGIHGPNGSMPLHKYARGGIAKSPQLAMFGEGRTPEAYVPLPDGRSIPVTMEGQGGVSNSVSIVVHVNNDGSSTAKTDSQSSSGKELGKALEVKVRQVLGDEMRPGGILWKMSH